MRILSILIRAVFSVLILSSYAQAASYSLPEVMVGQTTVTQDYGSGNIKTYYGGFTGNEAVFNSYPDSLLGFSLDSNCLANPMIFIQSGNCFSLDRSGSGFGIMRSKTSVNGYVGMETAALLWPTKSIMGDAYSSDDMLQDFAFWGRNLAQSGKNVGDSPSWGMSKYSLNPEAQSSFSSEEYSKYEDKINNLAGEAAVVSPAQLKTADWYLQGKTISDNSSGDRDNFPEGKAWYVFDSITGQKGLTIDGTVHYHGVGTIIIRGDNLVLSTGAKILPGDPSKDKLGIMVLK